MGSENRPTAEVQRWSAVLFGLSMIAVAAGAPADSPARNNSQVTSRRGAATTRRAYRKAQAFWAPAMSGTPIDFPNGYKGKLVLLNFWATWCPICKRELPFWRDAYDLYHDHGLVMIGVVTDRNRNRGPEIVTPILQQEKIVWDQIYDSGPQLSEQYNAITIPMSFLVDGSTGEIVARSGGLRGKRLVDTLGSELTRRGLLPAGFSTSRPSGTKTVTTQAVR